MAETTTTENGVCCECIGTRVGTIKTRGGMKQVFIVELEKTVGRGKPLVKFFNAEMTAKGNLKVHRDSDFAKLYRLATGTNPVSRYSRADQLLKHLNGLFFVAEEFELTKDFFKVTSALMPQNPIIGPEWTKSGSLRKQQKKPRKKPDSDGKTLAKDWQNFGNDKTLQTAKTLGLEPVLNPTVKLPASDTIPQYHVPTHDEKELLETLGEDGSITVWHAPQQSNETLDRYFDRIIDATTSWLGH
ncbi:hypothetical protein [Methylobacter sp.]|uniref:hypothetical protein n=1 Tax=Methylobacter sp. TaxID=2051955 RepID=UPI002489495E|nr:hypothetical protein [Methylobacter sp.]MDI1276708.1 hypothetical protein [Methylobacter sp.]MDI1357376.1 hypothetical protein [Methylobacter sp.]